MKKKLIFALAIILCISIFFGCATPSNINNDQIFQPTDSAAMSQEPAVTPSLPDESAIPIPLGPAVMIPGELHAHYIDVGQGDSEFIEFPDGTCMLIDAGESEYGETLVNYIKDLGYSKIDYLVATHPHADHIGGMADVINAFDIGSIYMPKATTTTKTYETLLETIQDKGLTIKTAKAGVTIRNRVTILAPGLDNYDDLNDYSAVIKVSFGETNFLFMGDASKNIEQELSGDISADVLKVGHHGSDTASSSEFISEVGPKYAIISAGLNNDYGHPHKVTLDTLNAAGVRIYGTYADGTITVTSDGTNISIDKDPIDVAAKTAAPNTEDSKESVKSTAPEKEAQTAEVTPPPAPEETVRVDGGGGGSDTVYVTETGSKYHRDGCQYLSKSKIPISRSDAEAQGYTSCSRCNP